MSQSAVPLEAEEPLALLFDRELAPRSLSRLGDGSAARVPWRLWSKALYRPLHDFLSRPGKAMRADLLEVAYRVTGGKGVPPPELPLFIEALHAGSLIIDDIEDDSDERRGAPTLHRSYGVPAALNGGSWLYFWAFELLEQAPLNAPARASAHRAATAALLDCHYGQALDISVRLDDLEPREILSIAQAISELKTGGLVALSTGLGALAAGADDALVAAATRFGRDVGTALQMLDDLSSVTNDQRRDKGHEDLAQCKPTWPWAWLSLELDARSFRSLLVALDEVTGGASPDPLLKRLRPLVATVGRERVHAHLERALTRFGEAAPGAPLGPLRQQLERLERSYGHIG